MIGWEFARLGASEVGAIAAVAAAVVLLWFLFRPRPPRVIVSSHVLWDQVAPKKRNPLIRELILLVLQLAMVAGVAVALGDPRRVEQDDTGGVGAATERPPLDRVHIIDTSLSMGALAGPGVTRLDRVRDAILADVDGLPDAVQIALIGAGHHAELLTPLGADRARARLALRTLRPVGVGAAVDEALALAAELPGLRQGRGVVEVWTDDPAAAHHVEAFTASTGLSALLRAPFGPAPNLAVSAFDLRAAQGIPADEEAFVRVANPGPWPAHAILALETADAILGEAAVSLAPGEQIERRYRFAPLPGSGIEAVLRDIRFDGGPVGEDGLPLGDALALDDVAYSWVQPVLPVRVWLVSDGNRFLERVLALLPGAELTRLSPQQYRDRRGRGAADVDVVFFDGFAPLEKRDGPLPPRAVYFGPPASRSPVPVLGSAEKPSVTDWELDHALFEGLVLRDLHVEQSLVLAPEPGDVRLLGTTTGALAVARARGDERLVVWGFPLEASDLPLRLAFPQTVVNAVLWMRQGRTVGEAAGEPWRLSDPLWFEGDGALASAQITDLRQAEYAARDADPLAARRATWDVPLGDGRTAYRFPRPGLFRVSDAAGDRELGVNLGTLEEARLADVPTGDLSEVPAPRRAPPPPPPGRPPWWILGLAVAALGLVEFGIWTR